MRAILISFMCLGFLISPTKSPSAQTSGGAGGNGGNVYCDHCIIQGPVQGGNGGGGGNAGTGYGSRTPSNSYNSRLDSPMEFWKIGQEGGFKKEGQEWKEYPPYAQGRYFTFNEYSQDADFIYLVDQARTKSGDENNPMLVRIPKLPGYAQWSYKVPVAWKNFIMVAPAWGDRNK